MNNDTLTALALADTMLATDASLDSLIGACEWVFDAALPWSAEICASLIVRTSPNFHYFSRHEVAAILLRLLGRGSAEDDCYDDEGEFDFDSFENLVLAPYVRLPPIRRYCLAPPLRPPKEAWLAALALPDLPTVGDLAAWLGEPVGALGWFGDQWRLGGDAQSRLQHYHYRWVPKRSGGLRLIEIPKDRLRRIQQKILRQILDLVPPHPAAHGFRRGHSCVTHAALHTGQRAVLRMDLKDFFPSIHAARIHALFEKLGYPATVAGALARMCVNRTPQGAMRGQSWAERRSLAAPHLPQGSPCSPALANLCAYRLDIRLASLAQSLGANYSRYADDLVFSGPASVERAAERMHIQVCAIALEEGFRVNTRKTRLMREGTRQQVTGVVVNRHPNIARPDIDRLKAILTNCARHGPASQNRDNQPHYRAWLAGKIAHVKMVNPGRAGKLQQLFDTIAWPQG
jgi:RNA-directed DNA polymerase